MGGVWGGGLPLTFVWSGRLGPSTKSRDITWSGGGCQGDAAVFIFQVVRQVIMVYDRDRGGNLRPAQWVTLWGERWIARGRGEIGAETVGARVHSE